MKCPKCQAKMLPVDGELFCLQCGTAVAFSSGGNLDTPNLEETTDPLLQKAITDSSPKPVFFKLPIAQASNPAKTSSLTSMRSILAPPRPALPKATAARPAPVAASQSTAPHAAEKSLPVALPALTKSNPVAQPQVEALVAPVLVAAPVAATSGGSMVVPSINLVPAPHKLSRLSVGWHAPSKAWLAGIVVFAVFLAINGAIDAYYTSRVYPGVRVGQVSVGNVPFNKLADKLAFSMPDTKLTANFGTLNYSLAAGSALGAPEFAQAVREAEAVGHTTPLPIAGAIESLFSRPVALNEDVDMTAVNSLVGQISQEVDHSPSNAVPMIVDGQAFVIADKSGAKLDQQQADSAITASVGVKANAALSVAVLPASVKTSQFDNDIAAAQTVLGLSLQIKADGQTLLVSPATIGNWIVFNGPGKGISVDGSAVSKYVTGISGAFDRAAATQALITAVQDKKSLFYTVSTAKTTAAPSLPSIAMALPMKSYSYCVQSSSKSDTAALENDIASDLSDPSGWSLGGRIKYSLVSSGCDFTVALVASNAMGTFNPSCAAQTSCLAGSQLVINQAAWSTAPSAWHSGLPQYRTGLVSQEVGNWLGFNHAACVGKAQPLPILASPTLVLDGCSPNWYLIPSKQLGSKILPGF
jgi:hypothetical protein